MAPNRIEQIKQALANAENNIRVAKQLLAASDDQPPTATPPKVTSEVEQSSVVGIYDGEKMVTTSGEVYPVPGNYASKSLLVVGDTLKMYEEKGEKRFKQIEHVKRHKTGGLLVKKDGKFRAITPEGSYKVLSESINHFNGEVGDEVVLHLPAGNLISPFGAIETVKKKSKTSAEIQEGDNEEKVVTVQKSVEETRETLHKPHPDKKPKQNHPVKEVASTVVAKPEPKKVEKVDIKSMAVKETKEEAKQSEVETKVASGNPEDELS